MSSPEPNTILATLLFSGVFWLWGYLSQKFHNGSEHEPIVSTKLNFLFSTPMGGRQLTLRGLILQLVAYSLAFGGLLSEVAIPDAKVRLVVIIGWMLALMIGAGIWISVVIRGKGK